jgi:hypothetical protein
MNITPQAQFQPPTTPNHASPIDVKTELEAIVNSEEDKVEREVEHDASSQGAPGTANDDSHKDDDPNNLKKRKKYAQISDTLRKKLIELVLVEHKTLLEVDTPAFFNSNPFA